MGKIPLPYEALSTVDGTEPGAPATGAITSPGNSINSLNLVVQTLLADRHTEPDGAKLEFEG